ncbi:MAG TPA: hypothetical protein VHF26_14325, partial [Trebonia sp.]|nr:hypothetical protein [Trebonia sp.]
ARGAADRPVPGAADRDRGGLAGLLARVAAMADQVPQLASLRLDVDLAEDGTARVTGSRAHIAPSNRVDPYLRRLRRAPVD